MQNKKVIVVGAGAAGVMAAGAAAENCADVLLLERNPKIGRKVLITGKGRCNVTHHTDEIDTLIQNIPGNGRFLYSAFSQFMPQDTVDFFEDYGVPLKVERGNRVFPQSDRAADIVDALSRYLADVGVTVQQARVTELLTENGAVKGIKTENGDYRARHKNQKDNLRGFWGNAVYAFRRFGADDFVGKRTYA